MASEVFNPHQIRITRFVQREPIGSAGIFEFEVDLWIGEGAGDEFNVRSVTIHATGGTGEAATVNATVRSFLDALIRAVQRERAGIRPGTP